MLALTHQHPWERGEIVIMSDLEYITRGRKKQQHFVSNRLSGRMILVLISLFLSSKESSSEAYGKGNKTGRAQYETWTHLAPYNLIQISLFILFHYLILISVLHFNIILYYLKVKWRVWDIGCGSLSNGKIMWCLLWEWLGAQGGNAYLRTGLWEWLEEVEMAKPLYARGRSGNTGAWVEGATGMVKMWEACIE